MVFHEALNLFVKVHALATYFRSKVQKVFSHFLQQVKLWLAGGSAQVAGPNLGFSFCC